MSSHFVFTFEDGRFLATKYFNGFVIEKTYYLESTHDTLDRKNGPAIIMYHRDDSAIATEEWYENGEIHRVNGPAAISYRPDGTIQTIGYYHKNVLHNEHGPAVVQFKDDGVTQSNKAYWINGVFMSYSQFLKKCNPVEYEKYCYGKTYYIAGKKYKVDYVHSDTITLRLV